MKNWQRIKNYVKYVTRKYFGYDLSTLKIKLGQDFIDQKNILSDYPVDIIFDIGANAGQTTHKYRKLFPKASIYGFEPFPEMFLKYTESVHGDKNVYPINIALSNQNGTAEFFVNKFPGANSLLPNNEEYTDGKKAYQRMGKIKVGVETVDDYCKRNAIERIHILKMDVQGGELLVLQGAKEMLGKGKIDLIYTEVMFVEIYKNQPLFQDQKDLLKQFGYDLYKQYNITYEKDDKPISGDAIFISSHLKI
jgi:FkbM family methyltransferase